MRSRSCLASSIFVALVVGVRAFGTVYYPPPQPLADWLSESVVFVGVGQVSSLSLDPSTGYASFTLNLLEAWKGKAPHTVSFSNWPFGHAGLSEGERMVFYAFNRKVTNARRLTYVSPEPVFRFGGRDCFRFGYASQAIPPENTIAVRFQGKAGGTAPIVFFNEFRAAVMASAK